MQPDQFDRISAFHVTVRLAAFLFMVRSCAVLHGDVKNDTHAENDHHGDHYNREEHHFCLLLLVTAWPVTRQCFGALHDAPQHAALHHENGGMNGAPDTSRQVGIRAQDQP